MASIIFASFLFILNLLGIHVMMHCNDLLEMLTEHPLIGMDYMIKTF